jgi:hypothetical protein
VFVCSAKKKNKGKWSKAASAPVHKHTLVDVRNRSAVVQFLFVLLIVVCVCACGAECGAGEEVPAVPDALAPASDRRLGYRWRSLQTRTSTRDRSVSFLVLSIEDVDDVACVVDSGAQLFGGVYAGGSACAAA